MRRSLILNILCPSGRNILMCFVVLMIVAATLITFILFDDITASPISVIYHIHSDIPHDWMTDILHKNYSHPSTMDNTATKTAQTSHSLGEFSWLSLFESDNNEIFVNGKSFSQIIHDEFRPSLANLLPQNDALNDSNFSVHDDNDDDDDDDDDDDGDDIHKYLEWYSSKAIPHLLANKLNINKFSTVSTKLIYHAQLQHFILLVITRSAERNEWALDIYERDARPFLWRYAFDTKHLYKDKSRVHEDAAYDSDNKQNELFEAMRNFEFWKSLDLALDLMVTEFKKVGVDISLGFDNLNELRDILQEIIVKESTENAAFHTHDLAENNIEKYIAKKREFYKSYYDIHADKIKVVYADWYHTEHVDIKGIFHDVESVFKWSANYKYLLIASYVGEDADSTVNRQRSQLHLFEFESRDLNCNESIRRLAESDPQIEINDDLLDKLQDYGYYKSSALNKIYSIKSHEMSSKHVSDENKFGRMTALTFTPCAVYYAMDNDYKLIRAVRMSQVFNVTDANCADLHDLNENKFEQQLQSFYQHEDSLMEITAQLTPKEDVIRNHVSDMMVLNASTLLITQQMQHNAYYMSYSTSLLHIAEAYQYETQCHTKHNMMNNRFYLINLRHLYRDKVNSNKYYYRHDAAESVQLHNNNKRNEHKLDRLISSASSPIYNMKKERKKENKLHFEPLLFLSNTQNDASSIITSTPYFISIKHDAYDFDDTVEIVNLKSMTSFTQSALNKEGDLLAILDNTDSILVLKKKQQQNLVENIDDLSFNEFLLQSGIKDDLSNILNNESMADILSQFIKHELDHNDNQSAKDEVEWKVSSEFSPTSIMSHLKPLDIICISVDDQDHAVDGYVVVVFENGVISSYVMKSAKDAQYQSGAAANGSAAILTNGTIDFWLGTCIDWIELMFLMSFAAYFVCSCCRRSSLRIGLGRERVINANANINIAQAQPPQAPPMDNDDDDDDADDADADDDDVDEDNNANRRAAEAAMHRMALQNNNNQSPPLSSISD